MKMLENLIGARIVKMDGNGFEVMTKNGNSRFFQFIENNGG